jgi:hypothetical protein
MCGVSDKLVITTKHQDRSIYLEPNITEQEEQPNITSMHQFGYRCDGELAEEARELQLRCYQCHSYGDELGSPILGGTLESPSTCSDHNIAYYNTNGTDIKLAGGAQDAASCLSR